MPNASFAYPFGAIDAKVSSYSLSKLSYGPDNTDVDGSSMTIKILARDHSAKNALEKVENTPVERREKLFPVIWTQLGPSTSEQHLLPFCWDNFKNFTEQHAYFQHTRRDRVFSTEGHPICFNYSWQQMPPLHGIMD